MPTKAPLFQHLYMIVSSNFELETLLKGYTDAYPNSDMKDYSIVFKGENEHADTPFSYIIVIDYQTPTETQNDVDLWEYIKAWCKLHPGMWANGTGKTTFPGSKQIAGQHAGKFPPK